jgi:uncharacterized protein
MELFERVEKITTLIAESKSHKIESKKKLHKLIYLLQQKGEDFDQDFTFHYFGVFSPSLARDLDIAKKWDFINVIDPDENKSAYTISLTKSGDQIAVRNLSETAKSVFAELVEQEPQFLEVLSTIVYLDRNFYRGEDLKIKLKELKPDLERHYTEAFKIANELFNIKV